MYGKLGCDQIVFEETFAGREISYRVQRWGVFVLPAEKFLSFRRVYIFRELNAEPCFLCFSARRADYGRGERRPNCDCD